jgi:hypothetical protein
VTISGRMEDGDTKLDWDENNVEVTDSNGMRVHNGEDITETFTIRFDPGQMQGLGVSFGGMNVRGRYGRTAGVGAGIQFKLHVDADNTTPTGYPNPANGDLGSLEESAAGGMYPGVLIPANIEDFDNDGVPDFADGIDKFGNGGSGGSGPFEPMLIEAPSLSEFPEATFVFTYESSDPDQMTEEDTGYRRIFFRPQGGSLRVWTKDGSSARSPVSVRSEGDFVQAGEEITAQQLGGGMGGFVWLYIEAVDERSVDRALSISVEFYPMGLGRPNAVGGGSVQIRPTVRSIPSL